MHTARSGGFGDGRTGARQSWTGQAALGRGVQSQSQTWSQARDTRPHRAVLPAFVRVLQLTLYFLFHLSPV